MKRILMIANDAERFGPVRLPEPLSKAGVEIAVLCPLDNPLNHSSFVQHRYLLGKLQSWRKFGSTLAQAMSDWKPDLVMPCDELVVVMLHYFLKRPRLAARYLNASQIDVLTRSIGRPEALDAMLLKQQTRLLAESLGVQFPKAEVAGSLDAALQTAARFGYPVFLKASFSWGGQGTIHCNNEQELATAFDKLSGKTSVVRHLVRRLLARDWYHTTSVVEVQQAIPGDSVMYSVAAFEGHVLGGLFACRSSRLNATGPSTIVSIGENSVCREMAEKMIAAMEASGFLAFDFMRCEKTGAMFLLECNPRPNQIFHLGQKVGSDLCQALADRLNDLPSDLTHAACQTTIPLFPQLWYRDEQAALSAASELDIPRNDPKLLSFMLERNSEQGAARQRLLDALGLKAPLKANYTFG